MFSLNLVSGISGITKPKKIESEKWKQISMTSLTVAKAGVEIHLPVGVIALEGKQKF